MAEDIEINEFIIDEYAEPEGYYYANGVQPSHPLSSPSPPAPNPSQHQSLFQ